MEEEKKKKYRFLQEKIGGTKTEKNPILKKKNDTFTKEDEDYEQYITRTPYTPTRPKMPWEKQAWERKVDLGYLDKEREPDAFHAEDYRFSKRHHRENRNYVDDRSDLQKYEDNMYHLSLTDEGLISNNRQQYKDYARLARNINRKYELVGGESPEELEKKRSDSLSLNKRWRELQSYKNTDSLKSFLDPEKFKLEQDKKKKEEEESNKAWDEFGGSLKNVSKWIFSPYSTYKESTKPPPTLDEDASTKRQKEYEVEKQRRIYPGLYNQGIREGNRYPEIEKRSTTKTKTKQDVMDEYYSRNIPKQDKTYKFIKKP